jgi:polysaccharide deacetylase family protein (PEP-CTERM system associated)
VWKMKNALTIDLEDYYKVSAFAETFVVEQWDNYPSRVEQSTAKLLSILEEGNARATFFTLGWVARKFPKLIREIADRHHEIACHSNVHRYVYAMTPDEFREDTLQAKSVLEDIIGTPVFGYRAPSFSITPDSLWAYEILIELGFRYDSSVFPIKHPNYGWPKAPRFPFTIRTNKGSIIEFPMPTILLAGARAPIGGGAYLRLLPYWFTRWGIRYINRDEEQAACVYLHPWELDSGQPRMQGSASARLRHYFGLRGAESKFRRMLADFEMQPLISLIDELPMDSSAVPSRSIPAAFKPIPEIAFGELGAYLGEQR